MSTGSFTSSFAPVLEGRMHNIQYHEERMYDVRVFHPHDFVLAIHEAFPHFSTRYAINLGAGDGKNFSDPVYPLFEAGYAGLAIDAGDHGELLTNLPSETIRKVLGVYITPMNVVQLLRENGCPQCPDMLKLDIDGYDGPILLEILKAGFRPKILQIEVNPEIPPPIEFAVLYDPAYAPLDAAGKVGGFYGASLGYVGRLAQRFGYRPLQIDFVRQWTHDVTLVDERYFPLLAPLAGFSAGFVSLREMFLAHPPGFSHFAEYGIDSRGWRYRTDYHELLREIWRSCLYANLNKHGNNPLPFHLTVG